MGAFIVYQLRPEYDMFAGGVINVAEGRALDVEAALVAGSGAISADATDSHLISALDQYWPLRRTGTSSSGSPLPFTESVVATITDRQAGDTLTWEPPTGWVNTRGGGGTATAGVVTMPGDSAPDPALYSTGALWIDRIS